MSEINPDISHFINLQGKYRALKIQTCTIFSVLFLNMMALAQSKECSIPVSGHGDTTLWYKWRSDYVKQMGLADLTESKDSLHFRFWTETQAIDVWTNDFQNYYGLLSNYASRVETDERRKDTPKSRQDKFYSEILRIDPATAKLVHNLFAADSVFEFNTDAGIAGWHEGFDGETFLIEYSTPAFYSFKEYWTPSAFKDIKEAAVIDNLSSQLITIINSKRNWGDFIRTLPRGCYRAGGFYMTCNDDKMNRKKK